MTLSFSRSSVISLGSKILAGVCLLAVIPSLAEAPRGKPVDPSKEDQLLVDGLKGKMKGVIVWSTSRDGNHDLYLMDADGTNARPLTKGPKTDWYPRFSPDGKWVLFTRSKLEWTSEEDANKSGRWDTWLIGVDGKGEKQLIADASWATWTQDGHIVYSRGKDVRLCAADGSGDSLLINGEKELKGALAQDPFLSYDGKFVALTLRGSERETGIFNLKTRTWFKSGGGCQFSFFPNSHKVIRVNQTGRGGTQIFAFDLKEDGTHGELSGNSIDGKDIRFMDLPGRRSHEYFPRLSPKADYLVWGATQFGHDHDIADYEIYLWKVGEPLEKATRLTFHSGNDRWPDIWIP